MAKGKVPSFVKQDKAMDKKNGIKENSKRDVKIDNKGGKKK